MEKIAIIVLAAALIMSVVLIVNDQKNPAVEEESNIVEIEEVKPPVLSFTCESTEVAAGDIVRCYIHAENCDRFATGDLTVAVDGNATITDAAVMSAFDMENSEISEDGSSLKAVMLSATVINLSDSDFYYFDISVPEDAKSGEEFTASVKVDEFQIGLDANGNDLAEGEPDISACKLAFKVA